MDAKGNYNSYRSALKQRLQKAPKEPTLPYLGVFLRDLTFVGEISFFELFDILQRTELSTTPKESSLISKKCFPLEKFSIQ